MKIDDLVANLERNAQEQDKIMSEQIQSVTKQHLASYNELLQSNLTATQKILDDHSQATKQSLAKLTAYKTTIGAILGALILFMVGLIIGNLWIYKKSQAKADELAQIQRQIEQTPPQVKALAKLEIGQNQDGTIWIQPKNPKKTKIGKDDSNGKPLIILE